MVVVWNIAHVIVDRPRSFPQDFVRNDPKRNKQSRPHLFGRGWIVVSPHDHRYQTHFAIRDPAVVVLEVSCCNNVASTEVTVTSHFTCKLTVENFFTLVPAAGICDTTEVHVGFGPEPGPWVK